MRQRLLPLALVPKKPPDRAPIRSELARQKRSAFDALRFALPRELARSIERFQCGQFGQIRLSRRGSAGPQNRIPWPDRFDTGRQSG